MVPLAVLTKTAKVRNFFSIHSFHFIQLQTLFCAIVVDCELPANIVFVMDESGSIGLQNHEKEVKFVRLVSF